MKSGLFLLVVLALLVVGPDDGRSASHCASVPEDGQRWLQPLCNAVHEIAAGEKESAIKVAGNGTSRFRIAKLWRNANGTTIDIDFRGGTVGSAVIARLLSGSAFIPTERIDKLVIRNASLDGTLDLSHATIEVAPAFLGLVFNSKEKGCNPAKQNPESDALVLVGAHVKKQLSFEKSKFCGNIRIASSQLDGGLYIGRGPDTAEGSDEDSEEQDTRISSLFVVKSDVDGEIRLGPVAAGGAVRFDRNAIDALTILDSEFNGVFEVLDNRLGALSVWLSEFGDGVSIQDNAAASSMKLRVLYFFGQTPPVIRDNEIDGGLEVTIRALGAGDADLSQNTVDRSAQIWLPKRWPGSHDLSLDLSGSVFRSTLSLCLARFDYGVGLLHAIPAEVDADLSRSCRQPDEAPTAAVAAAADVTTINLRSVEAATLAWRLPLNCSFRWDGTGLRYGHWAETTPADLPAGSFECAEAPPLYAGRRDSPLIGSTDGLMLMRHLMKEDDVDALNTMADYLESRGKIVESRDIRKEAKRANYVNIPEQASTLDALSRQAASWFLRPVGYGAKPELSLLWLFVLWIISFVIYRGYSYLRREDWDKLDDKEKADLGCSGRPGFMQFDKEKDPKDFDIFRYSIDVMLPVINLHTYDRYYPQNGALRLYAAAQHAVGWFLITIFLVSAAIL